MADAARAKTSEGDIADIQRDIEELRRSISALVKDIGSVTSDAKGRVGERVAELGADVRKRGEEASHSAQSYVRENPVQSVLIAFGVGLLVSRLAMKR